jgi:hypothetical protein
LQIRREVLAIGVQKLQLLEALWRHNCARDE